MNIHKNNSLEDHDSDPAHTPGNGWVDEGGASHLGPATHIAAAEAGDDVAPPEEHAVSESTEG